jgi:2-C-methyl-D-erythritol 4-phosphate cytidylyltransferase
MKKTAVIVAGGSGVRMGSAVPKQFLHLKGKPIIWHTVQQFFYAYFDIQIVLVLPASYLLEAATYFEPAQLSNIQFVEGGSTRFDSVKNGLQKVTKPSVIFVHDGVRCLVTADLIKKCYEEALVFGSAIPAVTATDSIRLITGEAHQVIDRNRVKIIQTPQTFLSSVLIPAFDRPYQDSFTDEATVVEAAGHKVRLIEGEYSNLKITRPQDLIVAETLF